MKNVKIFPDSMQGRLDNRFTRRARQLAGKIGVITSKTNNDSLFVNVRLKQNNKRIILEKRDVHPNESTLNH